MLAHFRAALVPGEWKMHQHGSLFRKHQPVHQEQPERAGGNSEHYDEYVGGEYGENDQSDNGGTDEGTLYS